MHSKLEEEKNKLMSFSESKMNITSQVRNIAGLSSRAYYRYYYASLISCQR